MKLTKALTAGALAGGLLLASTGVASADHGHYVIREDRDGQTHCHYIAEGQTSKQADDPGGHKFHDNVHSGQPGTDDHGTDFDKSANEEDRCDTVE